MKQIFYVPQRGEVIRVPLSVRHARRPSGSRLFLVLSPQAYNAKVGLALLCPISSSVKGYPFEVPVPPDLPVGGVVLADQVESCDWRSRRAEPVCPLPQAVVDEALGKLRSMIV